jgi:hypothetical protein
MWKAYDLVNRKSTILKRKEEATKSNNKAKAKLFDKVLKGKFNSLVEL